MATAGDQITDLHLYKVGDRASPAHTLGGCCLTHMEKNMREEEKSDELIDVGVASALTQGDPLDWAMEEIGGLHFKE